MGRGEGPGVERVVSVRGGGGAGGGGADVGSVAEVEGEVGGVGTLTHFLLNLEEVHIRGTFC